MKSLYELSSQYQQLQEVDCDLIGDTLDAIEGEISQKAENIGFVIKNLDSQLNIISDEIKRLGEMKKLVGSKRDKLKEYLLEAMESCDINKFDFSLFNITRIKPRDVLSIDDESLIPDDYIKNTISYDKVALLNAAKSVGVSGCSVVKGNAGLKIS